MKRKSEAADRSGRERRLPLAVTAAVIALLGGIILFGAGHLRQKVRAQILHRDAQVLHAVALAQQIRDEAEALGVIRPDEPAAPARLPDLDALFGAGPAARAYHAPVTNRRGARLANNFNPLQPRDAFGRWVDEDSPEAVLEERDNIRRGNRVVQWVLRHRADLDRGMYRREIGRISFKWGNPGDKANNYRGGAGISHILAKHGERAVRALPVVLAKGLIQDHPEGPDKRLVTYKGFVSSLAKTGSRRSWVITGFKPRRQVGA